MNAQGKKSVLRKKSQWDPILVLRVDLQSRAKAFAILALNSWEAKLDNLLLLLCCLPPAQAPTANKSVQQQLAPKISFEVGALAHTSRIRFDIHQPDALRPFFRRSAIS